MNVRISVFLAAAVFCVSPSWADWTHWRGPEQDGVSREKNLVDDWSPESGKNVLWTSDIGGRATPVILNGRVFLNCRTHHDVTDPVEKIHAREQVVCWDAKSGDVLWKDEFNVFQTDVPAPRVGWASMAGDAETGFVYVHSVSGIFRCYAPDGKVVWEHSLFEDYGRISGYGGRTQTPIVDEDRVIVSFLAINWGETKAPPPKHFYYAFDKRTGKLQWVSAPGGAPLDTNYSAPLVRVIDGTRMLIAGNADGGVYAINARTGQPLWGFRMSKRGLNASPVVDGKYCYISHGEDDIDSIEFGRVQCIDATGRGDVTQTHGVWRVDGIKAGYASLLVKNGILYVVADTGMLYALDSKTGDRLWEYNLGTVGKGSPVWADGKLYVMEVNGNIHILRPSREKCEKLSHVQLRATDGNGWDEIYASPAIDEGRIYLVTRDRTICLGSTDTPPSRDPIPPLAPEAEPSAKAELVQLVPFETVLQAGESQQYELRVFDGNGRLIKVVEPKLEVPATVSQVSAEGARLDVAADLTRHQGFTVSATYGDLSTTARVRTFPPLGWSWDFEQFDGKAVPATWISAFLKLQPEQVDGSIAMRNSPGKGKPSTDIWIGPSTMSGYTIQADVLLREQNRRLSSLGVTANRYTFWLKGNTMKLSVQSWAPHMRMAKEIRFRSDPDVWYTLKLRVDCDDEGAHVKGKVWPRDEKEPEAWTIEQLDPHPNLNGSPGLCTYSLADCYFDNVVVKENN